MNQAPRADFTLGTLIGNAEVLPSIYVPSVAARSFKDILQFLVVAARFGAKSAKQELIALSFLGYLGPLALGALGAKFDLPAQLALRSSSG